MQNPTNKLGRDLNWLIVKRMGITELAYRTCVTYLGSSRLPNAIREPHRAVWRELYSYLNPDSPLRTL